MKQLIVTLGLILLGIILASYIIGTGPDSLFTATKDVMIGHLQSMSD